MIKSPQNNVIVKVDNKYIGNISNIMKLSAIQNNTSIDPSDYVNIMGEVVAAPLSICKRVDYKGYSNDNIQVGDIAIFSYSVISNMTITEDDKLNFKNRVWYNGDEMFLCDIMNIYAVIRNEEMIMLNGHIMAETHEDSRIILPSSMKKTKGTVSSTVIYTGKNKIDIKNGDVIYYNPFMAQKYQIKGKPFVILRQQHVLAKRA
jgi:co-chaperonin GroES (HSP10)